MSVSWHLVSRVVLFTDVLLKGTSNLSHLGQWVPDSRASVSAVGYLQCSAKHTFKITSISQQSTF